MSLSFLHRDSAETFAERLRSLAHPMRLRILACLAEGERAVAELEQALDLRQPGLSQQLAGLREAGWVKTRRQAKSVFYSLASPEIGLFLNAVAGLLSETDNADRRAIASALSPRPAAPPPAGASQAAMFARTGLPRNRRG